MTRSGGVRARAVAGAWAVALVLAAVGLGAWARAGDSAAPSPVALQGRAQDVATDDPVPAAGGATAGDRATGDRATGDRATAGDPTTTAGDRTTTSTTRLPTTQRRAAPATTLPVPAPPPPDARAPTPEVLLGTLALPSIGVTAPLGEGVTLTQIDRSPGHWPGTAMPGEVGNVVVGGHRVTHTRPFYDLDRLEPGDPLVFTMNDGTTWSYRLVRTEIVDASALYIVDQTPARTATLFACHPKHSVAQRIVAHFTLDTT